MIYFDNSATTPIFPQSLDAYVKTSQRIIGNPSSLHDLGNQANRLLQQARKQIADLIHVEPEEIYFTSGGTEGDNWVLKGTMIEKREYGNHMIISGVEHPAVSETAEQLKEVLNFFVFDAKIVLRKKYYVVYMKEGSKIVDVLNIMEAHVALMELENVRILKDMRNKVNRRVNCETANINKTVSAAVKQVEDIEYIDKHKGLRFLDQGLQDIARLRLEHPEATLKELGDMLEPPVGKSGVNHRLKKIGRIAEEIRLGGQE